MNWGIRYLRRTLSRSLGRSLLSLMLAALLAFAFGVLTVLRGIYGELYQNVEVKVLFSGISYTRAQKIADSGYVRDAYYEYAVQGVMIELDDTRPNTVFFVNSLEELVKDPVEWDEGWDEKSFSVTKKGVCVMNAKYAAELGMGLGDKLRINERDWLSNISRDGNPFQKGETLTELRDRKRPFATIVGLVNSDREDYLFFIPTSTGSFSCLYSDKTSYLCLDLARYTLIDYHQAAEFTEYISGELDKEQKVVQFKMDTSNADRIYRIHQLIETLYPLTVAAALLLGGVLPGLTVLHASREISILRALGTKIRQCVGIYALAQVLCALVGLALGLVLVALVQRPDLRAVLQPFGVYLAAHLAACALGSGVFAWLCARKHILAQLQAKE